MKAKSRKRLLISSIAMLLVAMLALGTATFAWFTQNTSATAEGLTMRTSKTSSLLVSDDTQEYASSVTYQDVQAVMFPASSIDGQHWYYTYADATASYASTQTPQTVPGTLGTATANKYVFADQLNIKNEGDVQVSDITITVSGWNTSTRYLNMALVPVSNKVTGGDTSMTAANFQNSANVYSDAATAYNPVSATGAFQTTTTITPTAKTSSTWTISVPNLAANSEAHYNLFIWFEGQDTYCKDANAGQGISGMQFTITGTPVTES